MKAIRPDLARALAPQDPAHISDSDRIDLSTLLSWLDRFFQEGGDIVPTDNTTPALTGAGRGSPPLISAPSPPSPSPPIPPAASIMFTRYPISGATLSLLPRPQGRYDLIWESLSNSTRLFCQSLGDIAKQQAMIESPKPGGLDVVLGRPFAPSRLRSFSPRLPSPSRGTGHRFPPGRSGKYSSPSTPNNRSSSKKPVAGESPRLSPCLPRDRSLVRQRRCRDQLFKTLPLSFDRLLSRHHRQRPAGFEAHRGNHVA